MKTNLTIKYSIALCLCILLTSGQSIAANKTDFLKNDTTIVETNKQQTPPPPPPAPSQRKHYKETITIPNSVIRGDSFRVLYQGGRDATIHDRVLVEWQNQTFPIHLRKENGRIEGSVRLHMPPHEDHPQRIIIRINHRKEEATIRPARRPRR